MKTKISDNLKGAIKFVYSKTISVLKLKTTWVSVGSAISYYISHKKDGLGNSVFDAGDANTVDIILHGVEVAVCTILDGCS